MTSVKPRPSAAPTSGGPSEFEILKQNHRFLREDEDASGAQSGSWNEALARKFYSNLWREYALCDLKHYKSGNFALRWRTEDEVVSGSGETSCGNTRCKYHQVTDQNDRYTASSSTHKRSKIALHTLELPFGYTEGGEAKSALVKVVLCDKCVKKIMWKREQDKKALSAKSRSPSPGLQPLKEEHEKAPSKNHGSNLDHTRDSGQQKPDIVDEERSGLKRRRSPSRDLEKRHKRR